LTVLEIFPHVDCKITWYEKM